jgi:hypothetical protein
MTSESGTLAMDLSTLQASLQVLSAGQYMGDTTGIRPVRRACAAVG